MNNISIKVENSKTRGLFLMYLFGFLFAFHTAIPAYVNSSFLNMYISERVLGIVYALAAILTIFLFFLAPYVLRKFGNYNITIILILLEMLALTGLMYSQNTFYVLFSFTISLIAIPFIYFTMDIFLEGYSNDEATGRIRGLFLTLSNLAWIFSPFISGLLLKGGDYSIVYLTAVLFLVPMLLIMVYRFKNFKDSAYKDAPILSTIKEVRKSKNIKNIFIAKFLLDFFYAWMIIYTPLYLHKYLGFGWEQIGLIFSIMLIPFILVQFPLGKLADKIYGEKEILCIGFIIMAVSTGVLFILPNSSMWLWAGILFITRVGAAAVEIMCDTYFFKKVSSLNVNLIGFFRMSRPLAYMLGPVVATIFLSLMGGNVGMLFPILGIIMLSGIWFSSQIKDTK